jgi:hypothetical protein
MVEPLRHRQTKEAATDMFNLQPPRYIPTLPDSCRPCPRPTWLFGAMTGREQPQQIFDNGIG